MPGLADISLVKRGLTSSTHVGGELAAVGVVVKNMGGSVASSTRRFGKSKVENKSSEYSDFIREFARLEEHDLAVVSLVVLVIGSFVHGLKEFSVKAARFKNKGGVLEDV